jgi:hypothetical protein
MALCILVATFSISWACGSGLEEAFRTSLIVAGVALFVAWAGLTILFIGSDLGRSFDHLLISVLKAREIASQERVEIAKIAMQQAVSQATATVDAHRTEVARASLAVTTAIPKGLTDRDANEEKIVQAVLKAYRMADANGNLDGNAQSPFSKRAVGEVAYPIMIERLSNPGARWGIHGCASIATYDDSSKRWRINVREYPTPEHAIAALTGR